MRASPQPERRLLERLAPLAQVDGGRAVRLTWQTLDQRRIPSAITPLMIASAFRGQFSRPAGLLGRLAGWAMTVDPASRRRNAWAVELVAPAPDDRLLEIGVGPGLAVAALAARLRPPGLVAGVDHSPLMIAVARRRNAQAMRAGRVVLRLGGLEILPALPGPFDAALSVNVAHFWHDPAAALAAMRAVMRPRGRIITVYQPRHRHASDADADRWAAAISAAAREAGLDIAGRAELNLRPAKAVAVIARRR
jgi:SAM-dependent methyltransferase